MLGLDDTLARKRGLRMFGAGMHHDPLASTRSKVFVRWGHSWVVLGVIVQFRFRRGHWVFLPVLFRLYLNQKTAAQAACPYRTRPELGVEVLQAFCNARQNRRFHVVADSAYGGQNVLANLPANCDLTSRLLLPARLYDAVPKQAPGTNGRPQKRGSPLTRRPTSRRQPSKGWSSQEPADRDPCRTSALPPGEGSILPYELPTLNPDGPS